MKKTKSICFFCFVSLLLISCKPYLGINTPHQNDYDRFFSPAVAGPYAYTYAEESDSLPDFMSEVNELAYRIPDVSSRAPFPTIIFEPGFFSHTTRMDDIQNHLASHGFLVVGVNNTSHFNLIAKTLMPYKEALLQTVRYVVSASKDQTSPLYGLIDTTAIGVSGHSMGGGGTVLACDTLEHPFHQYIKGAIAMNPYGNCRIPRSTVPILFISSNKDSVINPFMSAGSSCPENVYATFQSVPGSTAKIFANFDKMGHNSITDRNILLPTSGHAKTFLPTMVSWFKKHVARDDRYQAYLDPSGSGFKELETRFTSKGLIPGYVYN